MYLLIDNKAPLPDFTVFHTYTDNPPKGTWGGERPKHLVQLGKSMWPKEVIVKIVEIFGAIGIPDPLSQKLVEPFAYAFGGKKVEGEADFKAVNWEMVTDYFEWEAASHSRDMKKIKKLQRQAEKKYGGIFSHYFVYEERDER